ncbi:hypothetical protein [Cupriavidus metallidurans]|uniref:hypothetical protein n=1 Tax=Cupriavidus metallidurans TaxID=119219 RepID=UPI000787C1CA|nr:hypothetical protein [Cupriavidus metallidurans]AVA36620.1 hypothetical protein C3Z06_25385 [Cupriavidus metallidurans]
MAKQAKKPEGFWGKAKRFAKNETIGAARKSLGVDGVRASGEWVLETGRALDPRRIPTAPFRADQFEEMVAQNELSEAELERRYRVARGLALGLLAVVAALILGNFCLAAFGGMVFSVMQKWSVLLGAFIFSAQALRLMWWAWTIRRRTLAPFKTFLKRPLEWLDLPAHPWD